MFGLVANIMLVLTMRIKIPFYSGMPICEAFAQIEQQPTIYDVVHVKHFDEVCFSVRVKLGFGRL